MARYIVRRLLTMLLSMFFVSIIVFAVVEIAPGNVARNILGAYATPEQEASMSNQLGLGPLGHYSLCFLVVWFRLAGVQCCGTAAKRNLGYPGNCGKTIASGGR